MGFIRDVILLDAAYPNLFEQPAPGYEVEKDLGLRDFLSKT